MIASTQTNHPLASISSEPPPPPHQSLDAIYDHLKRSGLRITKPRVAILNVLWKQIEPITIEDIHRGLSDFPCDLVTVYRCLATLESMRIVHRSFSHSGTGLYCIRRDKEAGYYVMDKSTSQLHPITGSAAEQMGKAIRKVEEALSGEGYAQITHSLAFFAERKEPAARTQEARTVPAPDSVAHRV